MRRRAYYRRAAKQFLAGTRFKAPFEMVQTGLKTLEEWVDLLNFERDLDEINRLQRRNRRSNLWSAVSKTMSGRRRRSHPVPIFLETLPAGGL
jgi:hypothetical protein